MSHNVWDEVSDEDLTHSISKSDILRRYEGLQDRVQELIDRYEKLRTAHTKCLNELHHHMGCDEVCEQENHK